MGQTKECRCSLAGILQLSMFKSLCCELPCTTSSVTWTSIACMWRSAARNSKCVDGTAGAGLENSGVGSLTRWEVEGLAALLEGLQVGLQVLGFRAGSNRME